MRNSRIVTILGTGSWGTALGTIVADNQHQVKMWSHRNPETLASIIDRTDILVSAVAMKGVRPTITRLEALTIPQDLIIVTATKGLDPITTNTPSHLWQKTFPRNPIVVLSGPNLAAEIKQKLPAATVVASHNLVAAKTIQSIFYGEKFRVYLNEDPVGTELGGTLKNVMAIASGVCDGMNLGTNAKAALLTRALPEMIRIGTHLGGKTETFFGLSGLGDLIATCDSPLSRNYQVGYELAQGKILEQILAQLEGTAEGVNTTKVVIKIANDRGIAVPIARQVDRLLTGKITLEEAVETLMARELKPEFGDLDF